MGMVGLHLWFVVLVSVLHVGCSSGGLFFMWCVFVWVLWVVFLVHSVRCHIVGLLVFGVRASVLHVCCSSGRLFFMWVVLHVCGVHVVRVHLGVVKDVLVQSTCGQTDGLHVLVFHVVWCSCGFSSCGRSSCGLFFLLVLPILVLFIILMVS